VLTGLTFLVVRVSRSSTARDQLDRVVPLDLGTTWIYSTGRTAWTPDPT